MNVFTALKGSHFRFLSLYRQFTKGNKVTWQLVVPEGFHEKVLRLAHETLLTEHLGIKKTLDRVVSEFFWPGVCGDVAKFCKSCDICQRAIRKGRVTKVPLGKLPLMTHHLNVYRCS